jgi:hypothetical protein
LTSLNGTFPFTAPGGLAFREDWGAHWHEVGNPSGRTWPGKYRIFLLEDPNGEQFMFGVSLFGRLKAVNHPSYRNLKSITVLIGALSFDANYHPGLQYAICQYMTRKKDIWNFHHDGRITIAKGGGSKKALLEHVRAIAPTLILNEEIFLGGLPEAVLTWEHVRDFLARFAAYAWLCHSFKEQVRKNRRTGT